MESLSGPQRPSDACSKLPSTHAFYCSLVFSPPKIMKSRFIIFLAPQERYDATTVARINISCVYFCKAQTCLSFALLNFLNTFFDLMTSHAYRC